MSFCRNGHAWNELNTYVRPNGRRRVCRACAREAHRRKAAERRAPAPAQVEPNYALARLRAERALVAAHRDEARELRGRLGHVAGTIELVRRHSAEHRAAYRKALAAFGSQAGAERSERAFGGAHMLGIGSREAVIAARERRRAPEEASA